MEIFNPAENCVLFTPATMKELAKEGLKFSFFPPNDMDCEEVVELFQSGANHTGLLRGRIISHLKDKTVEHSASCLKLKEQHLDSYLDGELAELTENLRDMTDY